MTRLVTRLVLPVILALLTAALVTPQASGVPTWQPATDLSEIGGNAEEPVVAVDRAGTGTAVWTRIEGAHYIVQAASRPAGGAWVAPVDLSAPGRNAFSPDLVVDPAGNATAVWYRYDGAHYIVQAATRPAGGTWSNPVDLSASGQDAFGPRVAVDQAGNATAVWYRNNGTHYIVQTATRPSGGAWSGPVDLSTAGQHAYDPQVAVNAAGDAAAVWYRHDGTHSIVQAAARPAGSTWSAPANLSAPGQDAYAPQVAVDTAGAATAIWTRNNGTHRVVQSATRAAAGIWTGLADLSTPGQDASAPQVTVDTAGTATAIWYRFNGTHNIVQSATRPSGGAWNAPTDLSAPGQSAYGSRVAVDPGGGATAVWQRYDGTHYIVQTATRPAGGAWGTSTDLSAPGQSSYSPYVVVDADGNAIAGWRRFNGANFIVQARGLDRAGPVIGAFTAPATGTTGQPLGFAVTASDVWSTVTGIDWDFGDGQTASGPSVTHTYGTAGNRTVTLTLTDAVGNTTTRTAPIEVIAAPAVPPQVIPPVTPPAAAPEITGLRVKPKQIEIKGPKRRTRTTLALRLTEDAKVSITLQRKGAKASKPKVVLRKSLDSGQTRLRLTSKHLKRELGTRSFKPGRYQLTAKASNSAGTDKRSVTLRVRR